MEIRLDAAAARPGPPAAEASPRRETADKIGEGARQFESLLLTLLLRSARQAGGGEWWGAGEDAAASPAMEMAEEQFSQALAAQGGLGLSRVIAAGLRRE